MSVPTEVEPAYLTGAGSKRRRRYWILALLAISQLMVVLDFSILASTPFHGRSQGIPFSPFRTGWFALHRLDNSQASARCNGPPGRRVADHLWFSGWPHAFYARVHGIGPLWQAQTRSDLRFAAAALPSDSEAFPDDCRLVKYAIPSRLAPLTTSNNPTISQPIIRLAFVDAPYPQTSG